MKAFDLEAAKNGAEVMTKDGRDVRIICTDMNAKTPIVALVTEVDKVTGELREHCLFCYTHGTCENGNEPDGKGDLCMKPVEREGFVALFRVGETIVANKTVFSTEAEATAFGQKDLAVGETKAEYIGCSKITYQE